MFWGTVMNYLVLPDEKRKLNNRDYYTLNLEVGPNNSGGPDNL